MTRREAREITLELLFEMGFHSEDTPEAVIERAVAMREIQVNEYVKRVFFGVAEKLEFIDTLLDKHSHGWKKTRISPVAGSIATTAPILPSISSSAKACRRTSIVEVIFLPGVGRVSNIPSIYEALIAP